MPLQCMCVHASDECRPFRKAFGADAIEYRLVNIQCLQMHASWQVGVQTLGQSLGHHEMVGHRRVLLVGQEGLVCVCTCMYTCRGCIYP